jgi:hypothetical protein
MMNTCYAKDETIARGLRKRKEEGRCLVCGDNDHWKDVCAAPMGPELERILYEYRW